MDYDTANDGTGTTSTSGNVRYYVVRHVYNTGSNFDIYASDYTGVPELAYVAPLIDELRAELREIHKRFVSNALAAAPLVVTRKGLRATARIRSVRERGEVLRPLGRVDERTRVAPATHPERLRALGFFKHT